MKNHKLILAAAVVAGALPFMSPAEATPGSHVSNVPITFTFDLDTTINCDNTGNQVSINGPIGLGSSKAHVWYQNNTKGTQQSNVYSGVVEATVTPAGGSVDLMKQPPQGGSGGNPWIFYDADGTGGEYGPELIGRCVDPSQNVSRHFKGDITLSATLTETFTSTDCSKTSAAGRLKHNQSTPAVDGLLMFDNNVNRPTHPSSKAAKLAVGLSGATSLDKVNDIKAGMGNPLVYLTAGDELADAQATQAAGGGLKLGRCNQLY